MKRAVVCGAGGFIGHHLVTRLKGEGYWVRGVDMKRPEFSETTADEFRTMDLREEMPCRAAVSCEPDEVYQLAADMGGMGFIESHETEIMRNNVLINVSMLHAARSAPTIKRYFFSSSACVYPNMFDWQREVGEGFAYPAEPHNEYGWEKLYSERAVLAFARKRGFAPKIARFENTYGPEGTFDGGREKAPAALCRKVALAGSGEHIEVWGDGSAVRQYTYIDDLIDGIRAYMESSLTGPVNIASDERVNVDELAKVVIAASGKALAIKHVSGPVGVAARNFGTQRLRETGWKPRVTLAGGIAKLYPWVERQVA